MPTKNLLVANKIILGIALFWTILIAFLCLVQFNSLPSVGISGIDKYVHCTFHFVFTILWSIYFSSFLREIILKTVIKIFLVSVSYGVLIELLQGEFTKTRKADFMDVLANSIGALIAVITLLIYKNYNQKRS